MQSVLRAGGIPVLLPEIEDEETAKAILDRLDGLLLAGGGDILPSRYGEETLPACGEDDPQRDIFELLIIPMAIARNMPIFGICRGIQVLNVAMGGTLIQDIESQQNIPKKRVCRIRPSASRCIPSALKRGASLSVSPARLK